MLRDLDKHLEFLKEKIEDLKRICSEFGFSSEVEKLEKIQERLESPFFITVFGEVNAGKSSFVNALLGIPDLCKTDVDICTDRITVIKFCEEPQRKPIDDITEEVCVNNPLLKGFVIVDTPGINSVLEHHTYITEKFLPRSDAILVVLPATNPHTKSVWDWIEKISNRFGKKLIFVLQQKDLLPDNRQLEKIIAKVKEYATERGIIEPKVFAVSALKELKGEKDSGFKELREFLRENYTGERQLKAKLIALKGEILRFHQECLKNLEKLQAEGQKLEKKLREVLALVERRLKEAYRYRELLNESVDHWINTLFQRVSDRIEELSLLDMAFRRQRVKEFLETLKGDIEKEIKLFVENTLIPKLELFENGVLKPAVEESAKRLKEFERFYKKLGNSVERLTVGDLSERFGENVKRIKVGGSEEAVAVMGGSLLAGSLLMLLSGSFVVDITGGVMASLGVLLGMGLIVRKKKKLKNELLKILQREVGERIKKEINKALDKTLEETLLVMRNYLTDRLQLLEKEKERIQKAKETLMSNISQLKKFNP